MLKRKNRRKQAVLISLLIMLMGVFAACGTKNSKDDGLQNELKEIVVGASMEPHAAILKSETVQNGLLKEGYKLKVIEYTDYIQPNHATVNGSLDANFFQHLPYLNDFNEKNGTDLVSAAGIHFEPLGIYPGKTGSLEEVRKGAVVAVPNDVSNEARALVLLEEAGLITLNKGAGLNATIKDIAENPLALEFKEIEAAQTVKVLKDVDLAVINGNYALEAGLSAEQDALEMEGRDSEAAGTYPNILAVKQGDEEAAKTVVLKKVLTSEETRNYIENTWKGAVIPVF